MIVSLSIKLSFPFNPPYSASGSLSLSSNFRHHVTKFNEEFPVLILFDPVKRTSRFLFCLENMRQYHQLYKVVPDIRRCSRPTPGLVPIVIAAQKPALPLICLCALASAPWKMLLFSARGGKEKPALIPAWCVPRVVLITSQSNTNTNSVSNNNKIMNICFTENLLHPKHLAEWVVGDNGFTRHRHLAVWHPISATYDICNHAHHHRHERSFYWQHLTKQSARNNTFIPSWRMGRAGWLTRASCPPSSGLGKPSSLQIVSAGEKKSSSLLKGPNGTSWKALPLGIKPFFISLLRNLESWERSCCVYLSLGSPNIGKSRHFTPRSRDFLPLLTSQMSSSESLSTQRLHSLRVPAWLGRHLGSWPMSRAPNPQEKRPPGETDILQNRGNF